MGPVKGKRHNPDCDRIFYAVLLSGLLGLLTVTIQLLAKQS